MSAPNLAGHPPHKHVGDAVPISSDEALHDITTYLAEAETKPHLHPDVIFTEHGPSFSRNAAEGGLILQLLRRVEKGLKGERIIAELPTLQDNDDEPFGSADGLNAQEHAALRDNDVVEKSYNEQMLEQGHEGIYEGEIGERDTGVADASHPPKPSKKRTIDMVEPADMSTMTKEERKRYKKQLHKQKQQEKNAAREEAAHAFRQQDEDVEMEDAAPGADTAVDELIMEVEEDPKQAKKEKKRREKEAKQRAQAQVKGEIPADGAEEPEAVIRPEERGRIEVVDRTGRDASDQVNGHAKERKGSKKKKAELNGLAAGDEELESKKKKKVKSGKKAGI